MRADVVTEARALLVQMDGPHSKPEDNRTCPACLAEFDLEERGADLLRGLLAEVERLEGALAHAQTFVATLAATLREECAEVDRLRARTAAKL